MRVTNSMPLESPPFHRLTLQFVLQTLKVLVTTRGGPAFKHRDDLSGDGAVLDFDRNLQVPRAFGIHARYCRWKAHNMCDLIACLSVFHSLTASTVCCVATSKASILTLMTTLTVMWGRK
jgi:hypothetical protein